MKHSPGPWIVIKDGPRIEIRDVARRLVAIIPLRDTYCHEQKNDTLPSPSEAEANARLIASAPRMLNLIDDLQAENEHYGGCPQSSPVWDSVRKFSSDHSSGGKGESA